MKSENVIKIQMFGLRKIVIMHGTDKSNNKELYFIGNIRYYTD